MNFLNNLCFWILILCFAVSCDTPAEEFAELIAESPCIGDSKARICKNGEAYRSQIGSPNLHCCEDKKFIGETWCHLKGSHKVTIGGEIASALKLKEKTEIEPDIKVLKYLAAHQNKDHCKDHAYSCLQKYIVLSYAVQGEVDIDHDLSLNIELTKNLFKTLEIPWDKIEMKTSSENRTILKSKGNMFSLCVENTHADCSKLVADLDDTPGVVPYDDLTEEQRDWIQSGNDLKDYSPQTLQAASTLFGSVEVNVITDEKLTTISVVTDKGTITTFRPSSLFTGSTVSGLVVSEPVGTTPEDIALNDGILKGCVVGSPEDKGIPMDSGHYTIDIPKTTETPAQILITDATGGIVTVVDIPDVVTTIPISDSDPDNGDIHIPEVIQTGRPFVTEVPSDGDITNTTVVVKDVPAVVLTESSDGQVITQVPPNITPGETRVVVVENDAVYTSESTVVSVALSADPYKLKKGQTTYSTVQVCGLSNLETPVQIFLQNLTPGIISFSDTTVKIDLNKLDKKGCWNSNFTGIGIREGNWNISGTIIQN